MFSPTIFTNIINSYLPEPHASLLNGIIFGVNLRTTKDFFYQLKVVGLLHIVVLSGINITLLASVVTSLTSPLGKKQSIFISIFVIIIFIIFVGPDAPVIRAGFMGVLTLIAILYGRKSSILYTLLLSIVFILLFWPEWLKTVSLQLSYGATLGIVLFGQVLNVKTKNRFQKIKHDIWKELKPSLAAQLFTVPIILFYFKQISLIAPLSNLLTAPVIAPLMIFGFLTAILGKIHYLLGLPFAYISFGILQYIIVIINFLSKLPYASIQF